MSPISHQQEELSMNQLQFPTYWQSFSKKNVDLVNRRMYASILSLSILQIYLKKFSLRMESLSRDS
jgi:hypothetical protein